MKRYYSLIALIMSIWAMFIPCNLYAETLTIANGTTTNEKVPFDGYNLDAASQQSQFILTADQLTPLINGTINSMTFYLNSEVTKDFTSTTTVSLGQTTLSNFESAMSTEALKSCYSGNLSIKGSTVTITLSTPHKYIGGNLLVDFSSTKGNYLKTTFYGIATTGNLSANKKATNSPTFYAFQPKTTFSYDPAIEGPALRAPEAINFSYIRANTSETKQIALRNIGSEAVTISAIEGLTAPFSISNGITFPITIESKGTYNLDVTFTPTAKCNLTQTITIKSNGGNAAVALSGSAYPETAQIESFENALWGSSPYKTSGWRHRFKANVSYSRSATGGFDNNGYIYHTNSTNYGDTIVTPLISGKLTYWAKTQNSNGSIKLFSTQDFQTWTAVTSTPSTSLTSTWTKYELSDIPENTYIGFVLANACLDEVFMEDAFIASKDIEVTSISSTAVGVNEGTSNEIKFSAYNWSKAPIPAADYSFEVRTSSGLLLASIPATTDLTVNGKVDITGSIVYNLTVKEITTYQVYVKAIYAADEDNSNNESYAKSVTVTPLIGSLKLTNSGTKTTPKDFGYIAGPSASRTLSVTLENTGIAPLTLSSISIKAPFTCDTSFPITLDAKGGATTSKIINITLQAAVGSYNDSIEIANNGIAANLNKIYAKGVVDPSGYIMESFHGNEFPPIHWEQKTADPKFVWKREVNGSYTNIYQTSSQALNIDSCYASAAIGDTLITPKMRVKSAESLKYYAKYSAASGSSYIKVLFSTDKQNWVKVDSVGKSALTDKFNLFSSTPAVADNTEGWFAFVGEAIWLDMIRGYHMVVQAKDLGIVSLVSNTGKHTANYSSSFTVKVRNYGSESLAQGSYWVVLKANDVEIARQEGTAIAPTEFGELIFNHVFNTAGIRSLKATIEMTSDENSLNNNSNELGINIGNESSDALIEVGICSSTTTNSIPSSNYKNAGVKSIYTATELGDLKPGMSIDSLYIPYYSSIDYKGYVQAWIGSTSEEAGSLVNSIDVTGMTHMTGERIVTGGNNTAPQYLKYKLSTPIIYGGGNLCIVLAIDSTSYKSGVTFFKKETTKTQSISYAKDAATKLVAPATFADASVQATNKTQNYVLAIRLKAERSAPRVGGFVKDEHNQVVEGAVVNFTAGHIKYATTTASNGYYEMQIFQAEKDFSVTVNKDGFNPYSATVTVGKDHMAYNITLSSEAVTEITNQESASIRVLTESEGHYLVLGEKAPKQIAIYTTSGQCIGTLSHTNRIDLHQQAQGVYILVITTDAEQTTTKVIR